MGAPVLINGTRYKGTYQARSQALDVPDGSLLFMAEEWGFQVVSQFECGIGHFERYAGAPFCIMRRR